MEKPVPEVLSDESITKALLLVESQHKDLNQGVSNHERTTKTMEERRRDGLWVNRTARHIGPNGKHLSLSQRKDNCSLPIRGMHHGDIDDNVEAMEYLRDWHIPYAPIRPDASVDAHVSVTRRINKCYERKLFYPHTKIPKTYHHHRDSPHPFFLSERLPGVEYKVKWGEDSKPMVGQEVSGVGCIGWSYRQRRSDPFPGLLV
jgi:hypothetical protein